MNDKKSELDKLLNNKTPPLKMSSPAIDLDAAAKLLNRDVSFPKKLVKLLIDEFPQTIPTLRTAYEENDWTIIQGIAHKLRGCSAFCGAFRLKEASVRLENYLSAGKIKKRENLYQKFLSEIIAVKNFCDQSKNLFE